LATQDRKIGKSADAARDPTQIASADPRRFPLGVALAGVLGSGAGLVISALGTQWGAATPEPDALEWSWTYVNVAMVWTWLLIWPAVGLRRTWIDKAMLAWDLGVLLVTAVPAMGMAAFLTGVPAGMVWMAAGLQISVGALAMGVMAWRRLLGSGLTAAVLAMLGVALPVIGYLWMEFFPAAVQGWRAFIPVVAAARVAENSLGSLLPWVAGSYALVGFGLWGTAPREA
jgi:hypothetical protein